MEYIVGSIFTELDVVQYLDVPLVISLLCVGFLIKHNMPFINNKYIPYILLVLALLENVFESGVNMNNIFNSIISATIAIGIHSSGKNIAKSNKNKDIDIISENEENVNEDE